MSNLNFGNVIWRRLIAASITLALLTGGAAAGTETWSGGDNNDPNWTSNGNWAGIGGAGQNDDLIFPAGAARLNTLNDFPINTNFDSLTFKSRGYTFTGNQIFLRNGMTIDVPGGAGAAPVFGPNIILGATQFWKSKLGFITVNGVVHLNNHNLVVDSGAQGSLVMNGLINGSGELIKDGVGSLVINGDADGFGPTTLKQGTLTVGGSLGSVAFSDGTLSGTGSVAAIFANCVLCQGTIAPGQGGTTTGILTSNGLVSLSTGVTVAIDIRGAGAGGAHDQLRAVGSNIDLNNANLSISLNFNFVPTVGQQFTILSQNGVGVITGQFSQGSGIVDNGQLFTITYTASSVILTAQGPVGP